MFGGLTFGRQGLFCLLYRCVGISGLVRVALGSRKSGVLGHGCQRCCQTLACTRIVGACVPPENRKQLQLHSISEGYDDGLETRSLRK